MEGIAWLRILLGNGPVCIVYKLLSLEHTTELETQVRREYHLPVFIIESILRGSCLSQLECHFHISAWRLKFIHICHLL